MAELIDKLRKLVQLIRRSQTQSKSEVGYASDELPGVSEVVFGDENVIQKLMGMVGNTNEREYTCEEAFAVLDEYVELASNEEEAAALMPLVKHHIDMCVDCREEYETLMRVLQTESSSL